MSNDVSTETHKAPIRDGKTRPFVATGPPRRYKTQTGAIEMTFIVSRHSAVSSKSPSYPKARRSVFVAAWTLLAIGGQMTTAAAAQQLELMSSPLTTQELVCGYDVRCRSDGHTGLDLVDVNDKLDVL